MKICNTTKRTTPSASFNDGTLIAAMTNIHKFVSDPEIKKELRENDGLGTEATRANIIETLMRRGFLQRSGKKIVSTESGRDLIGFLKDDVTSPGMTAILERKLKVVENEGGDPETVIAEMKHTLQSQRAALAAIAPQQQSSQPKPDIEPLPGHGEKCASCGKGVMNTQVVRKEGENKGKRFLSCSDWKSGCKNTIWADTPKSTSNIRATDASMRAANGPKCKKCGIGVMVERISKKSGKKFLACNNWKPNGTNNCDAKD